jgi:inosose dehydratase
MSDSTNSNSVVLPKTLKRREFLYGLGSLAALSPMSVLAAMRTDESFGGLPIGMHGATLSGFSNEEALRIVVEDFGLRRWDLTPSQVRFLDYESGPYIGPKASLGEVKTLRRTMDAAGVRATAYGLLPFQNNADENRRLFEFASELGVRNLTCIPELDSLDGLELLADEYNMRLAIHNNGPRGVFRKISEVTSALEGRGEYVGACLDIGHTLRNSEDPAWALRQLGSKTFGLHLKDVSGTGADSDVIGLGDGLLDTASFFEALRTVELPADIAISLEYLIERSNPQPGVLKSLQITENELSR